MKLISKGKNTLLRAIGLIAMISISLLIFYNDITDKITENAIKDKPLRRIFFIGNSFTFSWDIPEKVRNFINQKNTCPYRVEIDGFKRFDQTMREHYNNKLLYEQLGASHWDYIVLQDASWSTLQPEKSEFYRYMLGMGNYLKENYNTKPLLYLTWVDSDDLMPLGVTSQDVQNAITEAYLSLGTMLSAPVVPIGEYWRSFKQKYPDTLYESDGHHQNKLGAYFNALAFYYYFCDFPKEPPNIADEIPKETADRLWNVIQEISPYYYK